MEKSGFTTIPDWMLELDLDIYETVILGVIFGFSQDGESTFKGSQNYLARKAKCSRGKVILCLNALVEKGIIDKIDNTINGVKFCEYKVLTPCTPCTPREQGGCTPREHNNIDDNINISMCNNAHARKFDFAWALRGAGVSERHVAEWMEIRKTKKATNSQTAFDALVRESAKAGLSVDEAVTKCIEESWKGFRAIYMEERNPMPAASRPAAKPKESLVEHNRKAAEAVLRRLSGK